MSDVINPELLKRAGNRLAGREFNRRKVGESTEEIFEFRGPDALQEVVYLTLPKEGEPFEVLDRQFPAPPDGFVPGSEALCFIDAGDNLIIRAGIGAEWTRKVMGEHAGDEELSEALCTFGAFAESTILHGSAFITAQTALLVNPPVFESDVRDELSALVADAPGGDDKMMKTILALSRIKGGVRLRGCDSANMLAERLNELRTQIVEHSLKRSLRGAVSPVRVSPVRASPGGASNASLLNDGSIQVKVVMASGIGPSRDEDETLFNRITEGTTDGVGFCRMARRLDVGKTDDSMALTALADKFQDAHPERFFGKFNLKAAIKVFTLAFGHTEDTVVEQLKKMTGEHVITRDLVGRIAAYSGVIHIAIGLESAAALAAAPSELSAMLDGVVPRVTQDRDFDTIVRKAYARMLLDRARASRAAAAFDSPPEGLSHEAIKFLKTVYIPSASAGLTEELFELRQLVDGLRRKSQGGGGGGGGGDKMALVCRHWNGTEGSCTYKNCKYLHPASASDKKSTDPCRDFLKGKCARGATCRFSHDKKPVTAEPGNGTAETALVLAEGGESDGP